ncbi:hypothetical protein Syun_001244 [Stephania yunnanensis]|uniref:ATPase AAA-type core domain-containing protein n=1 Tax=Stephania yunnanensis TaxID=152371 RepID=A0AAP0Q7J8_9MAGN
MESIKIRKKRESRSKRGRRHRNGLSRRDRRLRRMNRDSINQFFLFFLFVQLQIRLLHRRVDTAVFAEITGLDQDPQEQGVAIEAQKKASQRRPHLFFLFVQLQGVEIPITSRPQSYTVTYRSANVYPLNRCKDLKSEWYDAHSGSEREIQRTMLELLNQLDGFDSRGEVKVILATNIIESLDPALLRPGRIDRKIEFPLPDIIVYMTTSLTKYILPQRSRGREHPT